MKSPGRRQVRDERTRGPWRRAAPRSCTSRPEGRRAGRGDRPPPPRGARRARHRVSAEMLDAGPLALVVRAGAGVNTIDVRAASARGIHVANCPGKNAVAVAELTLGLLLALDRRIPDAVAELRAGRGTSGSTRRRRGCTAARSACSASGAIGCEVIRRAHAFGLRVVAWSRRFAGEARWMTLAEARQLELEPVHQQAPIRLAPTPADLAGGVRRAHACTWRSPRDARLRRRDSAVAPAPRSLLRQHLARRAGRRRGARARRA
jgi:hypothetical protein